MARSTPRVALFGGTFDPIHRGHLAVAHAALASGLVDEVRFIPAGNPPHKPQGPRQTPEERWCMAVLATLDEPRFRVERWEIDRPGRSYAIDTLQQAHAALGQAELYWVIGADAMAHIHTWHRARELFEWTRFLVIPREGVDEAHLRPQLASVAPWAPADGLRFMAMPRVDVSSTELRARLATGDTCTDDLPASVATYIGRYGLYQAPQEVRS